MADTTCPVAALGREAARLVAAKRRNGEACLRVGRHSAEHTRLEREEELIRDRLHTVEAQASQLRAAGAMFQVMLAADEAEALASYAEDTPDVREHRRRITGCLYSVLTVLERLGDAAREELPADWHMSARHDPHAAHETALAGKVASAEEATAA